MQVPRLDARRAWDRKSAAAVFVLFSLVGCSTTGPAWTSLDGGEPIAGNVSGVWHNRATGHVVSFSPDGYEVFHLLNDFCIRDDGVVPAYSLYRMSGDGDQLSLHYFDYRTRPDLLQAPQVFRRIRELPSACKVPDSEWTATGIFGLMTQAFDSFYAFFDERDIDWKSIKADVSERAAALSTDEELFQLLSQMLAPLNDGHVNLTWQDRAFNAGTPNLRARLASHWAASGSDLSESAFVASWHQAVLTSVYELLDDGSRRSGAAGALEWGSIGGSVGYVRIRRFGGFTPDQQPRAIQYDALEASLREMNEDLEGMSSLIVDVAMNGGGSDSAALLVASFFADQSRPVLRYEAKGAPDVTLAVTPRTSGEHRPIMLLTSEVTASAAESFVLMMREFPHVTQVGGRTRGGLSALLPKPFPNGFRATLAYQSVMSVGRELYEGRGIPPQRVLELFPAHDLEGGFAEALRSLAEAHQPVVPCSIPN